MTQEDLNSTLANLQETLSTTKDVNDKTRELLVDLTSQIRVLLDEGRESAGQEASPDQSLSQRLKDMIVEFEVHHPQIGGLLERLSDGLANMGI